MKTQSETAGRRAISYVRFSTPKQEHGFSLARQLENTKNFCRRHRLSLDESLTVKDLGKSAFKGANADKGNLGVFLDAVREGKIARGTVLVVEALDRLTRNNIVEGSHLLTDILRHGIDIGLVSEDKVYSYDYINKNPFEFIVATTYLIRGGDESRMKSERVKDAWIRKKRLIAEKKQAVKIPTPCWLKREGDKWTIIEDKAKVVRQIFSDYLEDSLGIWMLSHLLNQKRVPVITQRARKGSKWHRITLHRILTDKATIGTYTNTEPPVEGYFPPIVSERDFYAVQAKLKDRYRYRGRHSLKDVSLFKGICKCGKCGGTMTRITRTRKSKSGRKVLYRYLYCHNSILGICLPAKCVNLTELERVFLGYTRGSESAFLFFSETEADPSLRNQIREIEGQILELVERRDRLVTAIEEGRNDGPTAVLARIEAIATEIGRLRNKKDEKEAELNRRPKNRSVVYDYLRNATRLRNDDDGPAGRLKMRELIRQFIRSMIIYAEDRRAVFKTISGKTRELRW